MPRHNETRTVQVWPSGKLLRVSGDSDGPDMRIHFDDGLPGVKSRPATPEERREVKIAELAERIIVQDILVCDSSLVEALLKANFDGFDYTENVENLYADPSDWTLQQCADYLNDIGDSGDVPTPNPWTMGRGRLENELEAISESFIDDGWPGGAPTDEELRAAVIANMDDGTIDGLQDWRDAVRDNSTDNPQEVYQWFRVSSWLLKKLRDIGQPVLDNDYGEWWGRTCCGQSIVQDGTIQEVAALVVDGK